MRGLVAFCLFGDDPNGIYYPGAWISALQYKESFPQCELWFYVGRSVPDSVIQKIRSNNPRSSFEFVDEPEDQTATWWRTRAVKHSDHDFILFRDVDSRLSPRETTAVDEWMHQSKFPYHIIRDHEYHGMQLLAGLWGIQKSAYFDLSGIPDRLTEDYYQTDQIALQLKVWPHARRKIMAHIGCSQIFERMDQRRPLVVPREKGKFVGQGFDGQNNPRYPEHIREDLILSDKMLLEREDVFSVEYRRKAGISGLPSPESTGILRDRTR